MKPKLIHCHINGRTVYVSVKSRKLPTDKRGVWSSESHRKAETKPGNVWPWRSMRRGDCVTIPYALANYPQIRNSVNGYVKNSCGAKFIYRSGETGLSVWCLKTREKKESK